MKILRIIIRNPLEAIGCCVLLLMVYAVILGVVARLLSISFTWTDELSRYTFIWMVFIGTIVAFKRGGHIGSDFVIGLLPDQLKKYMAVLIQVALLTLFGYLLFPGIRLVTETWTIPTTSLEIPTGLVYSIVPISFFISMFYTLYNMWKILRYGYVSQVSIQNDV